MANKDLRDWIDAVAAAGELKIISGAEPKEEIGGIVDIYQRRMGNPAVMFDEVPGISQGIARPRQYPDLGAAHQHRAWACRRRDPRWSSCTGGATT